MKCTIENKHLPALKALRTPGSGETLRISASGDRVILSTALGEAEFASRVAEAGVALVPIGVFLEGVESPGTKYWIEIEAGKGGVLIQGRSLGLDEREFDVSDDPNAWPSPWFGRR